MTSSGIERADLERRANRLGIPWTLQTSDQDLAELVAERERRLTVAKIEFEVRNGVLFARKGGREVRQPDECFGIFWSAVGDEDCNTTCVFKNHCLERFVQTTLPAARAKTKNLPELATMLQIPEEAVLVALEEQLKLQKKNEPAPEPAAEPDSASRKKKPPKPPKKKEQPKADTAKKKRRPPKARASATSASARAGTKTKASAKAAKAQADQRPADNNMREKWLAERQRNKLVGGLVPGMILTREWQGTEFQVRVHDGYYECDGDQFATLSRVVGHITGLREYAKQLKDGKRPKGTRKMQAWSARRFFQLDKIVDQVG